MKVQPSTVMPQPSKAFMPYGASEAGSRKMPMPITLPTIREVHIQKPSGLALFMAGIRGAQQVVEMPDAALALGIQAPRAVGTGRQPALHLLADVDVLGLDLVAEGLLGHDAGLHVGLVGVVIVE